MNILSIGLDRTLFDPKSDTFWRVSTYASWFAKYTVIVTTLKNENRKELKINNLTVIPTNSSFKLLYPLDILLISLKIRADNYALVTVQDPFICAVAGILVKIFLHIPLNIQIHSEFFNTKYFREESVFNRALYYFGLLTARFADTIRARNKRIANYFKNKKTFYVAAPINNDYLTPISKAKRDKNLIISIGRDVPQKNFSLLRDAVGIVKDEYPKIHLELIFGGKKPKEIKGILDQAGVFVLSSNHEGWGLVVLEALSRGCPVVMTNTGCAGEIVIDGETGYVSPIGDPKILAAKIIKTLDNYDHSLRMALAGRELVKNDCDISNIHRSLQKMFELTV